jgi:RHS repeat-associated protein
METNSAGNIVGAYTYGNDLISMKRADANSYYNYDGLGSTRQLTNPSGAVTDSYTYDSFGNLIASSGAAANAYGFTGQQQFGEADGSVFLRARYYDPRVGRFISKDLIGYKGGLNLYRYVENNPVNLIDSLGLKECPFTEKEAAGDSSFCGGFWANFPFHSGEDCYREVVPIGCGPSGWHCCYVGGLLHDSHIDWIAPPTGRYSNGSCHYDPWRSIVHIFCETPIPYILIPLL